MSQLDDYLNYLYQFAGRLKYDTRAGRCDPDHSGYADCSGILIAGLHHVGVLTPQPCMASGPMWQWCVHAGTTMSVQKARDTPGTWLFVGPGGSEHIAVSAGGGRQFAAHGHRYTPQVGFGSFDAHQWFGAAWPPGLSNNQTHPPTPTPHQKEEEMPFMCRAQGSNQVWLVDGFKKRALLQADVDLYAFLGIANGRHPDGTCGEVDPSVIAHLAEEARV